MITVIGNEMGVQTSRLKNASVSSHIKHVKQIRRVIFSNSGGEN